MTIPASHRGRSSGSEGMDWIDISEAAAVCDAHARLPHKPGKYAFFARSLLDLPQDFQAEATTRLAPSLLYIGKADTSLFTRVWEQECLHKRPGTFFRSVGAMLGYRSPKGGRNYEFGNSDKQEIIRWINDYLLVVWNESAVSGSHRQTERALIQHFQPLLNIQNNPRKFAELQRLRAICRAGQI